MREKEQKKILTDLLEVINKILKSGFKNRQHRLVDTVEQVQIQNYEIVEDENDRDLIYVHNILVTTRVFVIFSEDAKSSDNIILKNQKPIPFRYNKDIDNYEIEEETVFFFDATTF
ncbi:hypothetical protein [Flavobacterium sp. TAB 87]|uniref:hypothetical protein n=1 Tax=Flavobacterium sp. TAB 87 TaxID=1729581 RepID=UPI00076BCEE9|nr:hypothetical protein [Flavobacterium sp. TAB 87]KVV16329.1 hypothetical protein AP058_00120 [Flavobacterium sp. TAB 87]